MANVGKDFEAQIRESILKIDNIYYLRLQDPPQSFNNKQDSDGSSNNGIRFSNKNPYDFIMYKNPFLFTLENKSKQTNSLSWTLDPKKKSMDIKAHQITGLYEAYKKGAVSGFIINFRTTNQTYFLHIYDFMEFVKDTSKKSINKNDVIKYNGFLIPQTLKKVKYNYDIECLITECENRYLHYKSLLT